MRNVALALATAAGVPLAITGFFRLVPAAPTFAPFAVLLLAGILLWLAHRNLRPAAAGVLVGTVAYATFLAYVFEDWARGLGGA